MQAATRYIITISISLACISMLYFLSLVLHLPFFITVPVVLSGVVLIWIWTLKNNQNEDTEYKYTAWPALILAVGLALIIQRSYSLAEKYGGWDAWCIWNLHAKNLASGAGKWQHLFLNRVDHPDYPLLTPGVIGFFIRLFAGNAGTVIPFILGFSITLFIPLQIYLENLKKNIIVAAIFLFLFATDHFYLFIGVSQYADTLLAFFFLSSIICLKHGAGNRKNIALAAACLGCCMWTKNEGVILSVILIAYNAKLFFSKKNIKYFVAGLIVPFIVLAVFKIFYAPPNDLINYQGRETFNQLFMLNRYKLIWKYFRANLGINFLNTEICFGLYFLICVLKRNWPDRQMFMLLTCLIAYLMIYVLSTQFLEWHLATSQDRLMHQLMPSFMYIFSCEFAEIKWMRKIKVQTI